MEMKAWNIFPNWKSKNVVLVLGYFQRPFDSRLPAPCTDLDLVSQFCLWKAEETVIMNGFYCAIFQNRLTVFGWNGNCATLRGGQDKHPKFPKPACVFRSNWQPFQLFAQWDPGLTMWGPICRWGKYYVENIPAKGSVGILLKRERKINAVAMEGLFACPIQSHRNYSCWGGVQKIFSSIRNGAS